MPSRRPALLLLGLLLPAPLVAQDHTFTPHHVAKLRAVSSAVIAPDGGAVAYVLSVPRQLPKEKDGPAWAELHVVDARGNSTPYVTGAVNVGDVRWTPDGKGLSFLAKREKDEHRAMYVIPVRGGEARKVLSHGADVHSYSWSPDGKQVAFLAAEPVAKEKKAQQDQGFTQEVYEEDAPPIRVWIAAPGDGKPARMLKLDGSASELHWAPKGDHLAVALAPTPSIDDHLMFRKVHLVHVETGEAQNLKNPGKLGQLAWSPDGMSLAMITGADKHDPKEGRLWVSALGKGWVDLAPELKGHVESIAWRDANTLVYQASVGCETTVRVLDLKWLAGGKVEVGKVLLLQGGGPILSDLTARQPPRPPDDEEQGQARQRLQTGPPPGPTLAFVGNTPQHPSEVYYQGPEDGTPRRLTDSNPWLRPMARATQEVVKYRARDGLELEGVLVRPLGEQKGERYPLVLTVHGGPESHVSDGWVTQYHSLGQVGAAKGLAVFYPNYRGSTGRGVEFSKLGQKDAAGKEFDDLVDAVDHLVKTGLVDPKKVGITGGSYGGYATAWGATYYTERFAAGVMFVGISDAVSKVGTTDIPWEMYLVHHRKWLWDDYDYFLKRSPIYHADKAKTPLLILHGKSDPRVHPSQSLEMHRHLKVRNQAPVRLVLYPGEGHGNRRAASRLDYNLRLLQWMEHYLKGPGGAAPPLEIDYGLTPPARGSARGSWNREPAYAVAAAPADDDRPLPWLGRGCPCCLR